MIDEKKLIEDLKVQFDALYREDGELIYSDHVIIGDDVDAIIKLVNSQPQVGGWIPVSERLPKEYETVIGVTDLNYYCIAVYCKQHGFRSMDVGVESDIIAWQPLPEPYKESEEE